LRNFNVTFFYKLNNIIIKFNNCKSNTTMSWYIHIMLYNYKLYFSKWYIFIRLFKIMFYI
jgi:hypothetical protein